MNIKFYSLDEMLQSAQDKTLSDFGEYKFTFTAGIDLDKADSDPSRFIYADVTGQIDEKLNIEASLDGGADGYILDSVSNGEYQRILTYPLPEEVQGVLKAAGKTIMAGLLPDVIKEGADYFKPETDALGNTWIGEASYGNDDLIEIEGIGRYKGLEICADFNAEVKEDNSILPNHDKGKYYLSPVYNKDGDKAYVNVPQSNEFPDGRIYFDIPHDVLEACEKEAASIAYRIKSDEMQDKLYLNYANKCDKEDSVMNKTDWMDNCYCDMNYFKQNVGKDEAIFLLEHDDYIKGNVPLKDISKILKEYKNENKEKDTKEH